MTLGIPESVMANLNRFTGRTWLLPPLQRWLEESNARMLLLTGSPGAGKSAIIAWLAGAGSAPRDEVWSTALARIRSSVKAVHFCEESNGNTTPAAFTEALSTQLARSIAGFGPARDEALRRHGVPAMVIQQVGSVQAGGTLIGIQMVGSRSPDAFNNLVQRPLQTLAPRDLPNPTLVLVDALDEAGPSHGPDTLPRLLAQLRDLPTQVRFVVTTRPDKRVLKLFPNAPSIDLAKDEPAGTQDIREFVEGDLGERLAALPEPTRVDLARRITVAARGIFLHACLVLKGLPAVPDPDILPLPTGLAGVYHSFLNRELGADHERWITTFRPILGLIAIGRGDGLTRAQLRDISGLGDGVDLAVGACGQYLLGAFPDGPFRLFHRSFIDFLLSDVDNTHYRIESPDLHRKVARYCLGWPRLPEPDREYALRHGDSHAVESADPETLSELVRCEFFLAQADAFGEATALAGARRLADSLADSNDRLDDVLTCAIQHATLVERVRREPSALEGFIRRGQWDSMETVFELTSDKRQRGLLLLAATELCRVRGETEYAEQLRIRADTCISGESYTGVESVLMAALRDPPAVREVRPDPLPIVAHSNADGEPKKSRPRSTMPFHLLLLAYLSSPLTGTMLGLNGVLLVVVLHVIGVIPGMPYWTCLLGFVAFIVGLILSAVAAEILNMSACALIRAQQRLGAAARSSDDARRRTILRRMLRFHRLLPRKCRPHGEMIIVGIVNQSLEIDPPEFVGSVLRSLSTLTKTACAALVARLTALESCRLGDVLRSITNDAHRNGDGQTFLRVVLGVAARRPVDPELAADAVETGLIPPAVQSADDQENVQQGGGLKREVKGAVQSALTREQIARVLLTRLTTNRPTAKRRPGSRWATLAKAIGPTDHLVWVVLAIPLVAGVGAAAAIAAACLVVLGVLLWTMRIFRTWDQLGVAKWRTRPVRVIEDVLIDSLRTSKVLWESDWTANAAQLRRLQVALIAHIVIEAGEAGRLPDLRPWPAEAVQQALTALVRGGFIARREDAIRISMNDLVLLQTIAEWWRPARQIASRQLTVETAEQQVIRALPALSRGRHFAWVLGLSTLGLALSGVAWGMVGAAIKAPPPFPGTALAITAAAVLVACWQHLFSFSTGGDRPDVDLHPLRWLTGSLLLMEIGGIRTLMGWVFGELVLGATLCRMIFTLTLAPLVAGVLAPELIDRWHGADLLFPTSWQLWRQRAANERVTSYLRTDRVVGLYGLEHEICRVDLAHPEVNHTLALREMIDEAFQRGRCYRHVEPGLHYMVDKENDIGGLTAVIESINGQPYIGMVNMLKGKNAAYYPFTLSIANNERLYDFYNGDYMITVVIDLDYVVRFVKAHGFTASFHPDEALFLTLNKDEPPDEGGHLNVSAHMWNRLFAEFVGLEWLLTEVANRYARMNALTDSTDAQPL